MIAFWNTNLVIASLALGALALVSCFILKHIMAKQPTLAHGFQVFVLMAFVVTLPVQFGFQGLWVESPHLEVGEVAFEGINTSSFIFGLNDFVDAEEKGQHATVTTKDLPFDLAAVGYLDFEDANSEVGSADSEIKVPFPSLFDNESEADAATTVAVTDYAETTPALIVEPTESAEDTRSSLSVFWGSLATRMAPIVNSRALLLVHIVGMLGAVLIELLRLRKTYRIIRGSRLVTDSCTLQAWQKVAGVDAKRVELRETQSVSSPVCWGVLKPVVIIPTNAARDQEISTFMWALRHELVHIRRGDPRTTLFQSLLRIVFWFHPATWWFNRELDRLREISCDRLVVGSSGRRKSYAMALVEYARHQNVTRQKQSLPPTAPALISWSGSASQLERRIRMLAQKSDTRPRMTRLMQAVGAVTIALFLFSAQLSLAASIPIPQSPDAPDKIAVIDFTAEKTLPQEEPTEAPKVATIDFTDSRGDYGAAKDAYEGRRREAIVDFATANATLPLAFNTQDTLTIGLHLQPFDANLAKNLGMPKGTGLIITKVVKNSPASRAGLKDGDPILKINGKHASMTQVRAAKKQSGGKHPIKFLIMRGAKAKTIVVRFNRKQKTVTGRVVDPHGDPVRGSVRLDGTKPRGLPPAIGLGGGGGRRVDRTKPGSNPPSIGLGGGGRRVDGTKPRSNPPSIGLGSGGRRTTGGTSRRNRDARGLPGARSSGPRGSSTSSSQRKLEREVRSLKEQINRLTKAMERQGKMLERLMKSKSSNTRRNTRTSRRVREEIDATTGATRTRDRNIANSRRLLALEATEVARRSDELAAGMVRSEKFLAELGERRAREETEFRDLLKMQEHKLRSSEIRLDETAVALEQLKSRRAAVAAERAAIKEKIMDDAAKVQAMDALRAAEAELSHKMKDLRRANTKVKTRTSVLRDQHHRMVAEYERRIHELEREAESLHRKIDSRNKKAKKTKKSKKSKKSKKPRIEVFDDSPSRPDTGR